VSYLFAHQDSVAECSFGGETASLDIRAKLFSALFPRWQSLVARQRFTAVRTIKPHTYPSMTASDRDLLGAKSTSYSSAKDGIRSCHGIVLRAAR
jgi:hypothetical protein